MTPFLIIALIIFALAMFAEAPAQQQQQQAETPTPAALLATDLTPTPGDTDPATATKTKQQEQQEQQQQKAADKKPDDKTGPQISVQELIENATKPLRDELAALKAAPQALEKERRGYDAREDYIRTTAQNFPAELARKLLPATDDLAVLHKAGAEMERMVQGMLKQMVSSGRMKWVDVGGGARDSGFSPADFVTTQPKQTPANATPQQLLASDLQPSGNQQRQR